MQALPRVSRSSVSVIHSRDAQNHRVGTWSAVMRTGHKNTLVDSAHRHAGMLGSSFHSLFVLGARSAKNKLFWSFKVRFRDARRTLLVTSMSTSLDEYSNFRFPVTLVFSQDNPYNCTITLDEKPAYEVRSRRKIVKRLAFNDLLVLTDVFSPNGGLIASFVWHGANSDLITWPNRGLKDAKLSKWLKKSLFPFSR